MFEPTKLPDEMVKYFRNYWDMQLKTIEAAEGQTDNLLQTLTEQTDAVRAEGKQLFKQWTDMVKQSQAQYKKLVQDNIAKMESMIGKPE
jgi:hypothetical protein